jgi:hypothetical protein
MESAIKYDTFWDMNEKCVSNPEIMERDPDAPRYRYNKEYFGEKNTGPPDNRSSYIA